jgi:hypothetical protein
MLEGESQVSKITDDKLDSQETRGHSLLIVDFLSLFKKFNYKNYRIDLVGFGLAIIFVLAILILGFFSASIG